MASPKSFSIEVFPPKTPEAIRELRNTRAELAELSPKYFSITFGAGGSTQQGTHDIALEIQNEGYEAAPHITCIGSTREKVRERLNEYRACGIRHIVALRGDLPSSYGVLGEFHYASELVEFIRQETGDWFRIDVAAYPEMHPQAKSMTDDIRHFVQKVKAGSDVAITQYFYNPSAYFRFMDNIRDAGVSIPVIASGGAGTLEHFKEALTEGGADAALAASLFHYKELEIKEVKEYLRNEGISVRL